MMATIGAVGPTSTEGRTYHIIWEGLGDDDTGSSTKLPGASDRSVQLSGSFGGATVVVEGSNQISPTVWATLHDVNGDALSFTAAGFEVISENPLWLRVSTSGGTGTDVDVNILARSTMK